MLLVKLKQDNRPYINIKIFGCELVALLDTGISHSVIGGRRLDILETFKLEAFKESELYISTADGTAQTITGYTMLPIQVQSVVRVIKMLIVPSLTHKLILGSDFCEIFDIILNYKKTSYYVGLEDVNLNCVNEISCEKGLVNGIQSTSDLTEEQIVKLNLLKNKFKELSWMSGIKLGRTNATKHKIDTGSASPVKQRHHNLSPYMLEHLNKELDKMLSLGMVQPSISPWASPVLLVKKRNGEWRSLMERSSIA